MSRDVQTLIAYFFVHVPSETASRDVETLIAYFSAHVPSETARGASRGVSYHETKIWQDCRFSLAPQKPTTKVAGITFSHVDGLDTRGRASNFPFWLFTQIGKSDHFGAY